ncbi:hypothetical protein [Kutzneria sp. NPDC052558]|uniref:hypothetical protein n=1 Tax=Kutzneria sp. NPDC052558 TaxID=3364121 RepID=UPI0037C7316B
MVDRTRRETVRWQGAELAFRSASLVKLLIALDVLDRRPVTPALREALRLMLSASDDDVANELWEADGGPEIVERTARRLALPAARPPEIAGRWGDTMLGIGDVVATYEHILGSQWRDLIVGALAAAPRHGSDGFDQHFGIPRLPRPWAVKQGWSASPADVVLHSSGLVGAGWRFVVVVLASFPVGTEWATAAAAVDGEVSALSSGL